MTDTIHFYAKNRKEWRNWLRKNHKKERKVYLIKYKKHTKQPTLSHRESLEEAICWGWVDTTVKRLDDETYRRCFVKRTKKSRWSTNTISYAQKMIKEKKMTKAGLEAYKNGLKRPVFNSNLPKNPPVPEALTKALERNKKAKAFFANLAPSYKRFFIYWIERAKLPETKKRRIKEIVQKCKEGKKQ